MCLYHSCHHWQFCTRCTTWGANFLGRFPPFFSLLWTLLLCSFEFQVCWYLFVSFLFCKKSWRNKFWNTDGTKLLSAWWFTSCKPALPPLSSLSPSWAVRETGEQHCLGRAATTAGLQERDRQIVSRVRKHPFLREIKINITTTTTTATTSSSSTTYMQILLVQMFF